MKGSPADKHVKGHRREVPTGFRPLPVNSHSLDEMVHPNTLPMVDEYKFTPSKNPMKPGKMTVTQHRASGETILETAQCTAGYGRLKHCAVTSNRRRRDREDKKSEQSAGMTSPIYIGPPRRY